MTRARLGILLSGRGSNFLALAGAIERREVDAEIALVASNVPEAPGLVKAREMGLATEEISHRGLKRDQHEARISEALRARAVDWVCLAGYMRLLTPSFVDEFRDRILNIHPSLLPAFPGLDAQRQAWDYGAKVSGCTVHLVDAGMDTGPIVAQEAVSLVGLRSAEEAAAAILRAEHSLYPAALRRIISEPWHLEGRRVVFEPT
ncbi:MAG: phosphoribosylglycinamide formyltransferase [Holophagales bacterium]|nr:phosphoribosylglycinamide formyltransferase [Holophagales bacterium]